MKGAALAALGEIVGSFLGVVTGTPGGMFDDRCEGVKLGESTFNNAFFA
jgi:hypothetical protein